VMLIDFIGAVFLAAEAHHLTFPIYIRSQQCQVKLRRFAFC
jgi:hypothetical protein